MIKGTCTDGRYCPRDHGKPKCEQLGVCQSKIAEPRRRARLSIRQIVDIYRHQAMLDKPEGYYRVPE